MEKTPASFGLNIGWSSGLQQKHMEVKCKEKLEILDG